MKHFDWNELTEKYQPGTQIYQLIGSKKLTILAVDEEGLNFRWGVVRNGRIQRCNLERMAEMLEEGLVQNNPETLVNDYRTLIGDERPTTAIAILQDMGLVEPVKGEE